MENDSNFAQAADDARLVIRAFRGFERAAAALDKAAGLEQNITELTAAVASAQNTLAATNDQIGENWQTLERTRAEGAEIVAKANADAAAVTEKARADAEAARTAGEDELATARARAAQMLLDAQASVDKAAETVTTLTAEVDDLESRAAAAREYLAGLVKG